MQKLVLATHNRGKVSEFKWLLRHLPFELVTSADFDKIPNIIEDGTTFSANAVKKALQTAAYTKLPAIADDSGLVVDALKGAPGVYSARFAGLEATDEQNNKKLLQELQDVPLKQRTARFVAAIALAFPDGRFYVRLGKCEGLIALKESGEGGFGYDPLFYVPELAKTFAQMSEAEKNSCSHRSKALKKMVDLLENLF